MTKKFLSQKKKVWTILFPHYLQQMWRNRIRLFCKDLTQKLYWLRSYSLHLIFFYHGFIKQWQNHYRQFKTFIINTFNNPFCKSLIMYVRLNILLLLLQHSRKADNAKSAALSHWWSPLSSLGLCRSPIAFLSFKCPVPIYSSPPPPTHFFTCNTAHITNT